jgi:predicted rRNA methylase YqxC with S4 and FtsJ domains
VMFLKALALQFNQLDKSDIIDCVILTIDVSTESFESVLVYFKTLLQNLTIKNDNRTYVE